MNSDNPSGTTRDLPPEKGWTLRLRLLVTVTCALLPIAIISVLQGAERARLDVAALHEQLIESASIAATNEENILASGEQVARAVGNLSDVRNNSADCNIVLSDALIGVRFFLNLSRIDAHGRVTCSALPAARGTSVDQRAIFQQARNASTFLVSGQTYSPVVKRRVISGMLPLYTSSGAFDGVIAITLDTRWLDEMLKLRKLPHGAVVAIFDRSGTIIAASDMEKARTIFHHAVLGDTRTDRTARDRHGTIWSYATAALLGNNIFVGFAMGEQRLLGPTYLHVGTDFLMPIAMIALAWVAIWIATERQVTRWILYLRRVSAAYQRGRYAIRPQLTGAPPEFRLLGGALSDMASSIQDRDKRLRDAVDQKTILIREIHHRVKNNLQIVMSLLSLQASQLHDRLARDALLQAQVRINALALVHRILHETEDQATVNIKRLLSELTVQLTEGMRGDRAGLRVQTELVDRQVSGDFAVPLALFTVEALTNIFKHAYPPGETQGLIRVTLAPIEGGKLRLAVEDEGRGFATDAHDRNMGSRLIRTFGQQVGGEAHIHSEKGRGTVVELTFPDPDLDIN
jgi:two-component sensor histidine kinase